jgi:hypothetical protein
VIVSHARRFIFLHNPKTAGIALRPILAPYHDDTLPLEGTFDTDRLPYRLDFAHPRLWEIEILAPELVAAASTYRWLMFVRDPYRRFVSALDQHFKTWHPHLPLAAMAPPERVNTVEMLVGRWLTIEQVRTDHRLVHFSPQAWFFQTEHRTLPVHLEPMDAKGDFLRRGLDHLGVPNRPVIRANRSQLDLAHTLGSPTVRDFVRRFYAADFGYFAAEPRLRHLADGPSVPLG